MTVVYKTICVLGGTPEHITGKALKVDVIFGSTRRQDSSEHFFAQHDSGTVEPRKSPSILELDVESPHIRIEVTAR